MTDTDTFPTGQAIMKDAAKTIAALKAENAKLREALRPFAELCELAPVQSWEGAVIFTPAGCPERAIIGKHLIAALSAYRSTQSEAAALSGQDAEGGYVMPVNSETTPETDIAETLSQLARVKAIFQQRTIAAIVTERPIKTAQQED